MRCVWSGGPPGNGHTMERDDETQDPQTEETTGTEDESAAGGHDPTRDPRPPGNPDTDREAVEKGEDQLGRVTGR